MEFVENGTLRAFIEAQDPVDPPQFDSKFITRFT